MTPEMNEPDVADRFAHLKQRASERADRTVERVRAGIGNLQARRLKITAESIKQTTRELEPGFSGVSFQVIRRNPRAYEIYREAADAFRAGSPSSKKQRGKRRRRTQASTERARSSYDPLQRLDKRDLVQRIRILERELDTERRQRGALAYDQQAIYAQLLRLQAEIILLQAENS